MKTVGGARASGVLGRDIEVGVVEARIWAVEAGGLKRGGAGRDGVGVGAGAGAGTVDVDVDATGATGGFE